MCRVCTATAKLKRRLRKGVRRAQGLVQCGRSAAPTSIAIRLLFFVLNARFCECSKTAGENSWRREEHVCHVLRVESARQRLRPPL
jgi:hypothetical protein